MAYADFRQKVKEGRGGGYANWADTKAQTGSYNPSAWQAAHDRKLEDKKWDREWDQMEKDRIRTEENDYYIDPAALYAGRRADPISDVAFKIQENMSGEQKGLYANKLWGSFAAKPGSFTGGTPKPDFFTQLFKNQTLDDPE